MTTQVAPFPNLPGATGAGRPTALVVGLAVIAAFVLLFLVHVVAGDIVMPQAWLKSIYFTSFVPATLGGVAAAVLLFRDSATIRRAAYGALLVSLAGFGVLMLAGSYHGNAYAGLYTLALAGAVATLTRLVAHDDRRVEEGSFWIVVATVTAVFVFQLYQWHSLGRFPVRLLGETFVMITLTAGLIGVVVDKVHKIKLVLPFTAFLLVAFLAYNYAYPETRSRELPPALQSWMFVPHVTVYFIAYGTLVLAFVTAAASVVSGWVAPAKVPLFAQQSFSLVAIGFPFLTVGLVLGCFWGQEAWGNWWAWDPKENWALVTWLTYLVYLHLHKQEGWNSRRAAWTLIAGTGVIFMTYLAVNYLPTAQQSVHTYSAG